MNEQVEVVPLTAKQRYYLRNKESIKAKQRERYRKNKKEIREAVAASSVS